MKDYTRQLKHLCTSKHVYLNPELTLDGLAKLLNTNRTYLSVTLHEKLHTSFYGYINPLRVAHAAELFKNTNLSVKDVMIRSGFSSFNSFRRAFSAVYGCTPGEYQKQFKKG